MRAVNLIPAEQRSGAGLGVGSSEGAAYAVMALVAGIAVMAFLYGHASHQISSNRSKSVTLMAQAQRAQAESSRLAPYTSFSALRQQRIQAVSELVDSRFDWAHVFHEFGRVLPQQVSVSSLTGTIAGATAATPSAAAPAPAAAAPAPSTPASSTPTTPSATPAAAASTVTSATPPGSVPTFSLSGCATSQPAVALMLNRLRLIDGVNSVTLQSSTKSSLGAGAAGGAGCVGGEPAYSVQVAFDALPTPSATHSATSPVATGAPAPSAGGAR